MSVRDNWVVTECVDDEVQSEASKECKNTEKRLVDAGKRVLRAFEVCKARLLDAGDWEICSVPQPSPAAANRGAWGLAINRVGEKIQAKANELHSPPTFEDDDAGTGKRKRAGKNLSIVTVNMLDKMKFA